MRLQYLFPNVEGVQFNASRFDADRQMIEEFSSGRLVREGDGFALVIPRPLGTDSWELHHGDWIIKLFDDVRCEVSVMPEHQARQMFRERHATLREMYVQEPLAPSAVATLEQMGRVLQICPKCGGSGYYWDMTVIGKKTCPICNGAKLIPTR